MKIVKTLLPIIAMTFALVCLSLYVKGQFISTWQTKTPLEAIQIPTTGLGYDYQVDWGDGHQDSGYQGNATHTYLVPNTYTITITGKFPRIYFNNKGHKDKILSIDKWGNNPWKSMSKAFYGCFKLQITAKDRPNLSQVTDMSQMFQGACSINNMLDHWDVSKVTNMQFLFYGASKFNQALGNWNMSKVTNMIGMFLGAHAFNQDIGAWDVGQATLMSYLFYEASSFNQDIGKWDVGKVINMTNLFAKATAFNQDISKWNVNKVQNMSFLFHKATNFNHNLAKWNVENVIDMNHLFYASGLSNHNYAKTLMGWAKQPIKEGVLLGATTEQIQVEPLLFNMESE